MTASEALDRIEREIEIYRDNMTVELHRETSGSASQIIHGKINAAWYLLFKLREIRMAVTEEK